MEEIGVFSESMRELVRQANKYHQDRSIPVLIEGETGTGKEILAKVIHHGFKHEETPFINISCAALVHNLFETELFGYEGGSFTGGLQKGHKGKLDLAQGGTLFLDEISEVPFGQQVKLLRVLQDKEYYRVGGLKKVKLDARIICATNVRLEELLKKGGFRSDLYFRLKVGNLVIPPLRERKEAIIPLAKMFLSQFSFSKGKSFSSVSKEAEEILLEYYWPGNVRELKNTIEWVVFMHDSLKLEPHHLDIIRRRGLDLGKYGSDNDPCFPQSFSLPEEKFPLEDHINNIISLALKKYKGNKTKTACYLDISRHALYTRLENIAKKKSSNVRK